ncbi:prepilin-type N-terminal cleavage/methylation domain-containing protein, partial [Rhodanobacter denitrificans]|nr:prepilin-type N-terminal cleavage/methylation domain-containing protein [Rhodanobacter denitrificans]
MRASRANGFTLLEMLAVILLIGIAVAAVSVSVTQGLASARVRAASS